MGFCKKLVFLLYSCAAVCLAGSAPHGVIQSAGAPSCLDVLDPPYFAEDFPLPTRQRLERLGVHSLRDRLWENFGVFLDRASFRKPGGISAHRFISPLLATSLGASRRFVLFTSDIEGRRYPIALLAEFEGSVPERFAVQKSPWPWQKPESQKIRLLPTTSLFVRTEEDERITEAIRNALSFRGSLKEYRPFFVDKEFLAELVVWDSLKGLDEFWPPGTYVPRLASARPLSNLATAAFLKTALPRIQAGASVLVLELGSGLFAATFAAESKHSLNVVDANEANVVSTRISAFYFEVERQVMAWPSDLFLRVIGRFDHILSSGPSRRLVKGAAVNGATDENLFAAYEQRVLQAVPGHLNHNGEVLVLSRRDFAQTLAPNYRFDTLLDFSEPVAGTTRRAQQSIFSIHGRTSGSVAN